MLSPAKVREVEGLLAQGHLSQRRIAAAAGVSRATVGAIAAGRRPDYEARARANKPEPLGPLLRCGTCGGMVHHPCLLCRVRQSADQQREYTRSLRRRARRKALQELLLKVQQFHQVQEPCWPPRLRSGG